LRWMGWRGAAVNGFMIGYLFGGVIEKAQLFGCAFVRTYRYSLADSRG
jgi:hypothetical protein